MAFFVGSLKPNSLDVYFLSIGKEVPASAAAPNGFSLRRYKQSSSLVLSLPIIST